jgi:hypothetical protein
LRAFVRDVRTFVQSDAPEKIQMIAAIKNLLDESDNSLEHNAA